MATPRRSSSVEEPDHVTIQELMSYKLNRAANAMSRSAASRYRREFDVSLGEWRTLALLGADSPQTLNRLARTANLDKAQMSRVVSKLADQKLISREDGPGRTTQLALTRQGRSLYRALIEVANERDAAFKAVLTPEEQNVLEAALAKLTTLARALE